MTSLQMVGYLGFVNYLRTREVGRLDRPWGWKDPRNSYTLPIWMDLFPDALVIHLCRNGVDVAYSLRNREQHRQDRLHNPLFSCRCLLLEEAFSLWVEYESACRQVTKSLAKDRLLRVRFEDLLLEPYRTLRGIAEFLSMDLENPVIEDASSKVNSERAYAFLNGVAARRYYEQKRHHRLMDVYGYRDLV